MGTTPSQHHRIQGRLNSRVPVAIEWTEGKQTFRTDAYTVNVSPRDCLARVTRGFAVGQRLRLINLANQNCCDVVLVWCRNTDRRSWELGLELQESGLDFWGLDL